jgi:hypothetical protein
MIINNISSITKTEPGTLHTSKLFNHSEVSTWEAVLRIRIRIRIRIHRIHVFLGLLDPDPDPLVTGMDPDPDPALDPDPSIIMQK